ncbi:conserved hypothetical protein [Rippkaea orientalis PCC 8801]|uniref:Uncharacterized protein n=1 Tax=Rippkaea orientalis (strain PCC 8801 / RF-1) TaxID=41431 RepID=B7K5G0_RIPO1|nr:hypothetical protein [Rippkaea orientalis]ACK66693.1 conserved hypothetical protein [Rippkaea orientalis PCC 8801]
MNKHFGQIEIADLIEESVANAAIRRQQMAENSLVDVTEEEAKNIEGGSLNIRIPFIPPIILGLIFPPTIEF